jgi:hypothetical protein
MFDVKHKVDTKASKALRRSGVFLVANVLKGVESVDLIKFSINRFLPQVIPVEGM